MHGEVLRTVQDIKSLKIQGARNVAKAAISALITEAQASKAKTLSEFQKHVLRSASLLSKSRPTEPMMRNLLEETRHFLKNEAQAKPDILQLKKRFISHEKSMLSMIKKDKEHWSTCCSSAEQSSWQ